MNFNEYQKMAMRTKANYGGSAVEQLKCACLGLSGESGEFCDIVKKWFYQGHKPDVDRMLKEIGDVLWYCALAADAMGANLDDIAKMNIEKLKRRYPDGFAEERSRVRPQE